MSKWAEVDKEIDMVEKIKALAKLACRTKITKEEMIQKVHELNLQERLDFWQKESGKAK